MVYSTKKGSTVEPGNHRPVRFTSVVGKILEGFLRDSFLEYINETSWTGCEYGCGY